VQHVGMFLGEGSHRSIEICVDNTHSFNGCLLHARYVIILFAGSDQKSGAFFTDCFFAVVTHPKRMTHEDRDTITDTSNVRMCPLGGANCR